MVDLRDCYVYRMINNEIVESPAKIGFYTGVILFPDGTTKTISVKQSEGKLMNELVWYEDQNLGAAYSVFKNFYEQKLETNVEENAELIEKLNNIPEEN